MMINALYRWFVESRDRQKTLKQRLQHARNSQPGNEALHDPIEDDAKYMVAIALADALAADDLADAPRNRGFCYLYWKTKQRILKETFEITWFSPCDMNPSIRFD
ncbi:MAG: hypothetical protein AAGD25_01295 [Cyanobacteria bacterium P01_F01_bin.150]